MANDFYTNWLRSRSVISRLKGVTVTPKSEISSPVEVPAPKPPAPPQKDSVAEALKAGSAVDKLIASGLIRSTRKV